MNDEAKVGVFVLIGLALFGAAIFLLGDYSFRSYYQISVEFQDVAGLPDKSVVKLAGVVVGKIKEIYLKNDRVRVQINVQTGVKIYRNSAFLIGSTSVIGSKFLQIDQGNPASGVIEPGDVVKGSDALPIDRTIAKAVEEIQSFISEIRGDGTTTKDLKKILSNLREVTDGLNKMVTDAEPHTEKLAERLDDITIKLDSVLTKADAMMVKLSNEEGVAGALVSDKKMKEDLSASLNNLKDATASAKETLARVSSFRTYWNVETKYEPLAHGSKSDLGVKIYPREGRYYYLGGSNIMNTKDHTRGTSYETANTIDALLGWEVKGFEFYGGALHGNGGAGVKYRPFYYDPKWDRVRFLAEASEFGRRRDIKGRYFDTPRYDAGVEFIINRYAAAGVRVNDLAEVKRVNYTAHVMFEDKDIAYLLGLATLSSIGAKAQVK